MNRCNLLKLYLCVLIVICFGVLPGVFRCSSIWRYGFVDGRGGLTEVQQMGNSTWRLKHGALRTGYSLCYFGGSTMVGVIAYITNTDALNNGH